MLKLVMVDQVPLVSEERNILNMVDQMEVMEVLVDQLFLSLKEI